MLVVQPCVPHYRLPLFDKLHAEFSDGFKVIGSQEDPGTGVRSADPLPQYIDASIRTWAILGRRFFVQRIGRYVKALGRGDVLVISGNPRYISSLWWIWRARARGVGVIWWGHGWTPGSNSLRASMRRKMMKWVDVVLLYTDSERREYIARGFEASRVFATNNAIDQIPIQRERAKWTRHSAMAHLIARGYNGRKFLIFSSRLVPKVRLDHGLRALHLVRKSGEDVGLVVIGSGPMGSLWKSLASELDVPVEWLGEQYAQEEIAPWFCAAEAFLYPGAVGLSLLHAFGYGVPAIIHASRRHHNPEADAFTHGVTGVAFEEGSFESMAEAITLLLRDHQGRAEMGRNALNVVNESYSMDGMVRRFVGAIKIASDYAGNIQMR